ncbi:MAG: hypothetical protein E7566_00630 [Ruminococcaceae bacterium]|nr:hypothetical protein [Oscillospiraceae bacterium]
MKNKSFFSRLLENKKLMLIASFVLAFVFWIISSDNISKTIVDVPLQAVLSESAEQEGLKVYSVSPEYISVDVSGKRLIVDSLSVDDFTASVDLFNVSRPSTESYQIDVSTKSNMSFSIDGTNPLRVTVMVDKEVTKTIDVHKLLNFEPDEGYFVEDDMPATITITGPQSLVKEVKSAYVSDEISVSAENLTTKRTLMVHLCDKDDPNDPDSKDVHSEFIKLSNESFVDVNFEFFKVKDEIPITLKTENEGFTLPHDRYSFEPATLSIAGNEELLFGEDAIEQIEYNLGSISKYQNELVELELDVKDMLPEGLICTNTEKVKFSLDLSFLSKKQFTATNIETIGLSSADTYDLPESVKLTVVGTTAALSDLDNDNFSVTYDFTDVVSSEISVAEVPVSVKINKKIIGICWVYRPSDVETIQPIN